jgi:hypothetical protein
VKVPVRVRDAVAPSWLIEAVRPAACTGLMIRHRPCDRLRTVAIELVAHLPA